MTIEHYPHNPENEVISEIEHLMRIQKVGDVAIGPVFVAGEDGAFSELSTQGQADAKDEQDLYAEEHPELYKKTQAKLEANPIINDYAPSPKAAIEVSAARTAIADGWTKTVSLLTNGRQDGFTTKLERMGKRKVAQATDIITSVLQKGEAPKGTFVEKWDIHKPKLVVAVEEAWKSLSPIDRDPRMAPELIRSALLILRDGQKARPADSQQNQEVETNHLRKILVQIGRGEIGLSASDKPEPGKVRVAELVTAADMLTDAGLAVTDAAERAKLLSFALGSFKMVARNEKATDHERLFAMGHAFDIESMFIGLAVKEAEESGDQARVKMATNEYMKKFIEWTGQIGANLDKLPDGFAHELATDILIRYSIIERGEIGTSHVRLALGREDGADNRLADDNNSLNHDLVLESDSLSEPLRIQTKKKEKGTSGGKYNDALITMFESTDAIPKANQDAGWKSYSAAQKKLLVAMVKNCRRMMGAKGIEIIPHEKEILDFALQQLDELVNF